jgi:hypothetical protein
VRESRWVAASFYQNFYQNRGQPIRLADFKDEPQGEAGEVQRLREPLGADATASCPACGSRARTYDVTLADQVTLRSSLDYEARPAGAGKRKRFAWGLVGQEWSVSRGKFVDKVSHFAKRDRGDRRYERITDPDTGEVIHECDHKLTDHTGHGSDKPRQPGQ